MVIPNFIGDHLAGKYPFKVNFTNYSTNADSYTWNFGDGNTSTEQNPSHYYSSSGQFTVTLTASNTITSVSESLSITNYIKSFSNNFNLNYYLSGSGFSEEDTPYKTCNKFTTIGWVKSPVCESGDYLIPLAIEGVDGSMLDSDSSIKFMLQRVDQDYKFIFNNSESQLIKKSTGIKIDDGGWHFLQWTCLDDSGKMRYLVDGTVTPNRTGVDSESLDYGIAHNMLGRVGGGEVWCPYVYKEGQSISLYNWRFGEGFVLDDSWVSDLINIDKEYLGI